MRRNPDTGEWVGVQLGGLLIGQPPAGSLLTNLRHQPVAHLPQFSDRLSGLRHTRHAQNGLVADYAIMLSHHLDLVSG